MKVGKPKSKRVPVRLRHKIEKKSAEKQRKQRKQAKTNPEWRSRLKKDPGIPNLFPYKNKVLEELEESRRQKEAEKLRKQELAKAQREGLKADPELLKDGPTGEDDELLDLSEDDEQMIDDDDSDPMAALLASALARAAEYEEDDEDDADEMDEDGEEWGGIEGDDEGVRTPAARKDSSRKAFDKAFKSVIDASDVVLYVLDARDPEGTRSRAVEQQITASPEKRLILVLNKIDLIPTTVLRDWLRHLRRSFPTIPLRASTPSSNARTFDHKALTVKGTSETLFRALKTYAHAAQMKRAVTVGIIGYPNVGKSSVINSLTSRLGNKNTSCPVGAEAGVTTSLREVKMDNKLKLIDSPGIVFPSSLAAPLAPSQGKTATTSGLEAKSRDDERARLILLNAVPPKEIQDPIPAVSLLLRRLDQTESGITRLLDVYGIPPLMKKDGDMTTDFLVQVAKKRGRLGKGGVPNLYAAAMAVVSDWWAGRIQGWIEPPTLAGNGDGEQKTGGSGDQKEIVTQWAKEIKLDGLWGDDGAGEVEAEPMTVES